MSISAIILAAGQSKRMGQPKMLLPWGNTTVLGKVIQTIKNAGIDDITVVTNPDMAEQITNRELRIIQNTTNGEMLTSLQLGLKGLLPPPSLRDTSPKSDRKTFNDNQNSSVGFGGGREEGVLICLGDQPQVEERTVRTVVETFIENKSSIIVPSYQMRRGHPWLIAKELWDEVLKMRAPESMRDFLNKHVNDIFYVEHDSPSILQDIDTPEDYLKFKP